MSFPCVFGECVGWKVFGDKLCLLRARNKLLGLIVHERRPRYLQDLGWHGEMLYCIEGGAGRCSEHVQDTRTSVFMTP